METSPHWQTTIVFASSSQCGQHLFYVTIITRDCFVRKGYVIFFLSSIYHRHRFCKLHSWWRQIGFLSIILLTQVGFHTPLEKYVTKKLFHPGSTCSLWMLGCHISHFVCQLLFCTTIGLIWVYTKSLSSMNSTFCVVLSLLKHPGVFSMTGCYIDTLLHWCFGVWSVARAISPRISCCKNFLFYNLCQYGDIGHCRYADVFSYKRMTSTCR